MPLKLVDGDRTVQRLIMLAAEDFTGTAIIAEGGRVPFADLSRVAARAAGALAERGVGAGDRVVAIGANSLPMLEAFLGCAWLGSMFVPLNPEYPAQQIAHFTDYVKPSLILADQADAVAEVVNIEVSRVIALRDGRPSWPGWALGEDVPPAEVSPSTPLAILMTSGTTGASKGVICPQGQFVQWGESVGELLALQPGDVAYSCLPLFHTNALNALIQAITYGATFHSGPKFSVSHFLSRIREADASASYLLGALVGMLLTSTPGAGDREHRLSRILAPGTPVPAVEAFEARYGVQLIEGHGMTETNLTIAPPAGERRLGFMGRVLPGFEARIVDERGAPVEPGTPGELLLRTSIPYAFATGYWQMPEATEAATMDGWFRTGDRVVNEHGWYRFLDRIKDVIRRRGENISAWEVEQVLDTCPDVLQSSVVPVPAELGEDEVMAFVRLHEDAVGDPAAIMRFAGDRLPPFAVPRYVEFVTEFPLTDTGKVRKQALRDRGVGPSTWDRLSAPPAPR